MFPHAGSQEMDCEKVGSLLGGPPGSQEMDCEKVGSLLGGPADPRRWIVKREAVCWVVTQVPGDGLLEGRQLATGGVPPGSQKMDCTVRREAVC